MSNPEQELEAELDRIIASRPAFPRHPTGLGSVDYAFGGGIEEFSKLEIAGPNFSGKTTLALALAASQSGSGGTICFADLEGKGNGIYANVAAKACKGWKGTLWVSPFANKKGEVTSHADRVDTTLAQIDKAQTTALVLDSIGAYTTVRETEGSVEDANIGKAAIAIKTMYRIMMRKMEARPSNPVTFYGINHIHEKIGGTGSDTGGGKAPGYYSDIRVRVWSKKDEEYWTLNGTVTKRRGPGADEFSVQIVPEEGVHWGLSAVQDCALWGLCKAERTITMDGKSYGYYVSMVRKRDDEEMFAPFVAASRKYVQEKWGA